MKIAEIFRKKYQHLSREGRAVALFISAFLSILFIVFLFKGINQLAHFIFKKNPDLLLVREKNTIFIPPKSVLRQEIKTQAVQKIKQPHLVVVPGAVEADPARVVNVYPPVMGRLIKLHVALGQEVKANQLLAEVQSGDLASANADYKRAEAAKLLAEKNLARTQGVYKAGGNTLKDLQIAENDYKQAVEIFNQTQARLKTLGQGDFGVLKILAPIDGQLTAIHYGLGSYLTDVTEPLFTLTNIDQVWITADVPETLAGIMRPQQPIAVFLPAYPKLTLESQIGVVNAYLEPDTRRNKARTLFQNTDHKLQPNMFASVQIKIKQPLVIMIPVSSILMNDDETSVFVETAPWTFVRREIQIGLEDSDMVRVLSGLSEGEHIVIDGGILIND